MTERYDALIEQISGLRFRNTELTAEVEGQMILANAFAAEAEARKQINSALTAENGNLKKEKQEAVKAGGFVPYLDKVLENNRKQIKTLKEVLKKANGMINDVGQGVQMLKTGLDLHRWYCEKDEITQVLKELETKHDPPQNS